MYARPFSIELEASQDREGQIYYHGTRKSPCQIDCRDGVAFMIFTSEPEAEELQIACVDTFTTWGKWQRTQDGIRIKLKAREDKEGATFYLAKIKFNGFIDLKRGASFRVFTSREGDEQLQIRAYVKYLDQNKPRYNEQFDQSDDQDETPRYSEQDVVEAHAAS